MHVDRSIAEAIPELKGTAWEKASLRDVLEMASGIEAARLGGPLLRPAHKHYQSRRAWAGCPRRRPGGGHAARGDLPYLRRWAACGSRERAGSTPASTPPSSAGWSSACRAGPRRFPVRRGLVAHGRGGRCPHGQPERHRGRPRGPGHDAAGPRAVRLAVHPRRLVRHQGRVFSEASCGASPTADGRSSWSTPRDLQPDPRRLSVGWRHRPGRLLQGRLRRPDPLRRPAQGCGHRVLRHERRAGLPPPALPLAKMVDDLFPAR